MLIFQTHVSRRCTEGGKCQIRWHWPFRWYSFDFWNPNMGREGVKHNCWGKPLGKYSQTCLSCFNDGNPNPGCAYCWYWDLRMSSELDQFVNFFGIFQQHVLCSQFSNNIFCVSNKIFCVYICVYNAFSQRWALDKRYLGCWRLKCFNLRSIFNNNKKRNRCEFKKKDTKPVVSVLVSLFHVICKFHKVLWDFLDHMFQVKILGSDEIHVKEGSGVSLRCAITNTAQVLFSFLKLFSSNQLDVKIIGEQNNFFTLSSGNFLRDLEPEQPGALKTLYLVSHWNMRTTKYCEAKAWNYLFSLQCLGFLI